VFLFCTPQGVLKRVTAVLETRQKIFLIFSLCRVLERIQIFNSVQMNKDFQPISLILKLVLSFAFFTVLLSFVKGNELLGLLLQVNWPFFILSFIVTLVMVGASCAKWKIILDLKCSLPYLQLFRIYLVGYFFSNILPSTVGGDVVRSYYAGKLINSQAYSAVSVFVERFSGIFLLFFLVIAAPLFKPELYQSPSINIPAWAGAFFIVLTLWVWKARAPFALPDKIAHFLFQFLQSFSRFTGIISIRRLADFLERLYLGLTGKLKKVRQELDLAVNAVKHDRRFLWRLVYLTALFYVLTWVNVYTAFRAFNVDVDFIAVCAIVPAVMLVAHVPVTLLGNLGYFESVFVFYFLLVGIGGAESLAMGLLLRLKMLVMGVLGYFIYLTYKQKNKLDKKLGEAADDISKH